MDSFLQWQLAFRECFGREFVRDAMCYVPCVLEQTIWEAPTDAIHGALTIHGICLLLSRVGEASCIRNVWCKDHTAPLRTSSVPILPIKSQLIVQSWIQPLLMTDAY